MGGRNAFGSVALTQTYQSPVVVRIPSRRQILNATMTTNPPPRPAFSPPSELEAKEYYAGLPGPPKLVARLGSQVFVAQRWDIDGMEHDFKRITTIGTHALREHVDNVTGGNSVSLRTEIIDSIQRLQWSSLDFVRIGWDSEDMRPTILIAVSPNSAGIEDARLALEEVWEACHKRGIHDVEIEILEARSVRAGELRAKLLKAPYPSLPFCGASLAPSDRTSSGTLGCYVTLKGKHPGRYILTNDHIAFANDYNRPGRADEIFDMSITPECQISMESPSQADHADLEQELEQMLKANSTEYRRLREESEKAERYEREQFRRSEAIRMNQAAAAIGELTANKTQISAFDRRVGCVAFASGTRKCSTDESRLDWALIALDSNTPLASEDFQNSFPAYPQVAFEEGFNKNLTDKSWFFNEMLPVTLFRVHTREYIHRMIKENNRDALRVAKCGRTTGWTVGKINEIEANCKRRGDDLVTTEITVVNFKSNRFAAPGDSGSLVLDARGGIIGQFHTVLENVQGDFMLGRLCAIESIIDDIKAVTGATEVDFGL